MARKSSLRHQKQLNKLSVSVWGKRERVGWRERERERNEDRRTGEISLHFNILAHYIFICIESSLSYVTKYILT